MPSPQEETCALTWETRSDQQRALLRRLAGSRFGGDAAERLAPVLERIADPERLAEVGDLIVRCETADELPTRADAAQADPRG